MTEALNIRPEITDLALTVEELKSDFLFGLSFLDDNGNAPTDRFYETYIRGAMEWIQNELDVVLMPTPIVRESHDYYMHDLMNNGLLHLFRKPVQSVSRYALQLPFSDQEVEFDPTWIRCNSFDGSVNLIPGPGQVSRFLAAQGSGALASYYGGEDYAPLTIFVDYICGFPAGKIPADIHEVLGMYASIGPLNVFGDLVSGAGIASKSISLDGLSQSIATTSSATNSGYTSRITQYQKQLGDRLDVMRGKYRGIRMVIA